MFDAFYMSNIFIHRKTIFPEETTTTKCVNTPKKSEHGPSKLLIDVFSSSQTNATLEIGQIAR